MTGNRLPPTVVITCVRDRRAHLVDDDAQVAGMIAGTGEYAARCGHLVRAGALVSPDGPPCPNCALLATQRPAQRRRRTGRHRASVGPQ